MRKYLLLVSLLLCGFISAQGQQLVTLDVTVGGGTGTPSTQNLIRNFDHIVLPDVQTDTNSGWNATTNVYTVPTAGLYLITSRLRLKDSTISSNFSQGVTDVGNTDGPWMVWNQFVGKRTTIINARTALLSQGEVVAMLGYCDSDSLCNIDSGELTIQQLCTLSLCSGGGGGGSITSIVGSTAGGLTVSVTNGSGPTATIGAAADGTHYIPLATDKTNWDNKAQSKTVTTNQWLSAFDASTGLFSASQPTFSNLSGTAAVAQLPTATTSTLGIVRPDNTSVTISNGVLSAVTGGSGTVTHSVGALTSGACVIGNGTGDIKVDTGCSTDGAGTMTLAGLVITSTLPGYDSLVAGTGTLDALTANSAGWLAPATGGTAYLAQMPGTATAGVLHFGTPATVNGVNVTQLTSGQVNLASEVTGALSPTNWGTLSSPAAGDIYYWNGSAFAKLAGNSSGTNCLQESSSGVPSWASCGTGGTMTWPAAAGIANYNGSSAWGTSITTSAGLFGVISDETGSGSLVGSDNALLNSNASLGTSTGSGRSIPGTSLTVGSAYYVSASGLALAEANASTTTPAACIAVTTTRCLYSGVFRFSASQSWTVGGVVYLSAGTAGALTQTAPSTSGQFVQRVGIATANDTILWMPSLDVGGIQ